MSEKSLWPRGHARSHQLPDRSAARHEAELAARELLAEAIKDGKGRVPDAFVIADEQGREIDTVLLAAALPEPFKK